MATYRAAGYDAGADYAGQNSFRGNITVARPEVTALFAGADFTQRRAGSRSSSVPAALRKLDASARVNSPRQKPLPSPTDMERRLAYLQAKHAAYDEYYTRPRNVPEREYDEQGFVRKMDGIMAGNELTRAAATKVQMHEAMLRQKAHTRHFEWTKRVYQPIQGKINEAVDREFPRIHAARTEAMSTYLSVTNAKNVYLNDVPDADYDAGALNRTAAIKAPVHVVDPLKRVVEKTWEELELVKRQTHRKARAKDTLAPSLWTKEAMEATPHGHFEAKDLAGGVQMAFAGKDNESSLEFLDYAPPHPTNARGRVDAVDAEFPKGKRIHGYPYRFQDSTHTVAHPNVTKGIYSPGEKHTDSGGTRLDNTIADVMRNAK